jgi:hypothetical protein
MSSILVTNGNNLIKFTINSLLHDSLSEQKKIKSGTSPFLIVRNISCGRLVTINFGLLFAYRVISIGVDLSMLVFVARVFKNNFLAEKNLNLTGFQYNCCVN